MTADKPEDAPTTEPTTEPTTPLGEPTGSELQPTPGREVGQGVEPAAPDKPTAPETTPRDRKQAPEVHRRTRIGGAFVALAIGIIVLVLLLIFIVQNNTTTTVKYFAAQGQLPLGVLLLFAAAGGALLVVIFGAARILQLRFLARRDRRTARDNPARDNPGRKQAGA